MTVVEIIQETDVKEIELHELQAAPYQNWNPIWTIIMRISDYSLLCSADRQWKCHIAEFAISSNHQKVVSHKINIRLIISNVGLNLCIRNLEYR
jgi:hypothetical protein